MELEQLQNKPTVKAINSLLKEVLWRKCKFITDYETAEHLAMLVLGLLGNDSFLEQPKETLTQKLEREVCYSTCLAPDLLSRFLVCAIWFAIATQLPLVLYVFQSRLTDWLELYLPAIIKGLNDHRNYVGTERRKVAVDFMEGTQGVDLQEGPVAPQELPPPEVIEKLALRDFSFEPPENWKMSKEEYNDHVFEWYITRLLAVVAGSQVLGCGF